MILTTAEQSICVYDRKSPRHHWRLMVSTADLDHARACAAIWKARCETYPGWERYEQQIAVMHHVDGVVYDNLPSNYRWVHPDSTEPDVVHGTVILEK